MKSVSAKMFDVRGGFTLIELLVVISIIAVLISILIPAIGAAREQAKFISCKATQRQMGVSLLTYTWDFKNCVPTGWLNEPSGSYSFLNDRVGTFIYFGDVPMGLGLLQRVDAGKENGDSYVPDPRMFFCPASVPTDLSGFQSSVGWNTSGQRTRGNSYIQSGWYYRYTYGAATDGPPVPPLTVSYRKSTIEYLASQDSTKASFAALWDVAGTRQNPTVFEGYNSGMHNSGYNILYYNGAVLTLSMNKYNWPVFPLNTWYNDQTDPWATVNGVFRNFFTLVDLPLANGQNM